MPPDLSQRPAPMRLKDVAATLAGARRVRNTMHSHDLSCTNKAPGMSAVTSCVGTMPANIFAGLWLFGLAWHWALRGPQSHKACTSEGARQNQIKDHQQNYVAPAGASCLQLPHVLVSQLAQTCTGARSLLHRIYLLHSIGVCGTRPVVVSMFLRFWYRDW